jgi:hypothetical protein
MYRSSRSYFISLFLPRELGKPPRPVHVVEQHFAKTRLAVTSRGNRQVEGCGGRRGKLRKVVAPRCSAFLLNNHAFEPRLVEPKSPLPGNGIFRAETSGRSGCEGSRTPLQDKISLNNPAHSGLFARIGKSPFARDCVVVADAVAVEPVSARKIPC